MIVTTEFMGEPLQKIVEYYMLHKEKDQKISQKISESYYYEYCVFCGVARELNVKLIFSPIQFMLWSIGRGRGGGRVLHVCR